MSSSSWVLKKAASLKIDSNMSSVAILACSGLMAFVREDSVGRVILGGSDGIIGLVM